jgi:hypothetical protein
MFKTSGVMAPMKSMLHRDMSITTSPFTNPTGILGTGTTPTS